MRFHDGAGTVDIEGDDINPGGGSNRGISVGVLHHAVVSRQCVVGGNIARQEPDF